MLLRDDQEYSLVLGDCMQEMARMPSKSIDFSVFSPPFSVSLCVQLGRGRRR